MFGIVRRATSEQYENLEAVRDRIELVQADLLDELSLVDALKECRPHEVFNLASPSFVPMSWKQPVLTAEFAAVGVTALLESIRLVDPGIRFYQASSSEIFGEPREVPQTEETALLPVTPYGVAKAYGHLIVRSYRKRYGLYACSGILYNHESPRRPLDFVHAQGLARRRRRSRSASPGELWLGDLDARRDWGYAGDYVPRDGADAPAGRARRLRDRDRRRCTASRSWSSSPSRTSASTGTSTSTSTSRSAAARPSSTISSATRRRRASGSAGRPRSTSRGSSASWSTPTSSGCGANRLGSRREAAARGPRRDGRRRGLRRRLHGRAALCGERRFVVVFAPPKNQDEQFLVSLLKAAKLPLVFGELTKHMILPAQHHDQRAGRQGRAVLLPEDRHDRPQPPVLGARAERLPGGVPEDHAAYHLGELFAELEYFVLFHEVGHALVDQWNIPVLGREEDAVDAFSTIFMTEFVKRGDFALAGADFFYYLANTGHLKEVDFADEHSFDKQRAYSIACWVYGSDPVKYADLKSSCRPSGGCAARTSTAS